MKRDNEPVNAIKHWLPRSDGSWLAFCLGAYEVFL